MASEETGIRKAEKPGPTAGELTFDLRPAKPLKKLPFALMFLGLWSDRAKN